MPPESYIGSHWASKPSRDPKTVDYSPRKQPEMPEITSFDDPARIVHRGSRGIEILPGPKTMDYSPRKRQKCPKSLVLSMPLESCTGGHRASNTSRDPKTVDYSPRKRPEMPEITSFDDVSRVVYRGSWGVEILPRPKNHGL